MINYLLFSVEILFRIHLNSDEYVINSGNLDLFFALRVRHVRYQKLISDRSSQTHNTKSLVPCTKNDIKTKSAPPPCRRCPKAW